MRESLQRRQEEFSDILKEMDGIADQFYYQKLVEWSSGNRQLVFRERLESADFEAEMTFGDKKVLKKLKFLY